MAKYINPCYFPWKCCWVNYCDGFCWIRWSKSCQVGCVNAPFVKMSNNWSFVETNFMAKCWLCINPSNSQWIFILWVGLTCGKARVLPLIVILMTAWLSSEFTNYALVSYGFGMSLAFLQIPVLVVVYWVSTCEPEPSSCGLWTNWPWPCGLTTFVPAKCILWGLVSCKKIPDRREEWSLICDGLLKLCYFLLIGSFPLPSWNPVVIAHSLHVSTLWEVCPFRLWRKHVVPWPLLEFRMDPLYLFALKAFRHHLHNF